MAHLVQPSVTSGDQAYVLKSSEVGVLGMVGPSYLYTTPCR